MPEYSNMPPTFPTLGIAFEENDHDKKTKPETTSGAQWIKTSPQGNALTFNKSDQAAPDDTAVQKRTITPIQTKLPLMTATENSFRTDKKQFDQSLASISNALMKELKKRDSGQSPYWIEPNRYPIRQFRAYYLLALDKEDPVSHQTLCNRMNELEQKFIKHRQDLLQKEWTCRFIASSDCFNTLAAIQFFLGKTSEAKQTVQQGMNFEPDTVIFSLQDAQFDLKISDIKVLEGFPPMR